MDKVEELLTKRKWVKDCLRLNIAQPEQIISRGKNSKFKVALVQSNLLGKKEQELREAIQYIAPEWWGDETQVILNKNVQCKRHKDKNKEHSWIIWLGDFTGGALCFDDGTRLEEQYKWHKVDGQIPHWNEPHEGTKYGIVLYRSGAKKTKIQHIIECIKKKKDACEEDTPVESGMQPKLTQVFTEAEADDILAYLLTKDIEYHKPYKRFNKTVKVPRGQASYTLNADIHYNYGNTAGGSPINEVMDDRMREILRKVNEATGNNYNTILMNVYKTGKDNIAQHQDKETDWEPNTGFATVAFGETRPFTIIDCISSERHVFMHEKGLCIEMPFPMNQYFTHGVPPCNKARNCRVSLTFRQIAAHRPPGQCAAAPCAGDTRPPSP